MRKEHTPWPRLDFIWDDELKNIRRGLSYGFRFYSASDPRHFTAGADALASRDEFPTYADPPLYWIGR